MSSPPTLPRHLPTLLQRATTLPHHLQLHGLILKTALDHHHRFVPRLLSPMCTHSIQHARSIFDALPLPPSIHAWNTMIRAYAKSPRNLESIRLFSKLRQAGFNPNNYTYPFVLKACGSSLMVDVGRTVHGLVLKVGFVMDTFVGNTLLHMYACAGVITSAKTVFDEMPMRDVVSWSSMVEGYVSCDHPVDALAMFRQMRLANVEPNSVTLISLLSASSHLTSVKIGQSIHSYILVNKLEVDVALGTALVDMYAKCGYIDEAFRVFSSMKEKDLQTWTIMISGFSDHGRGEDAIALFNRMESNGMKPDSVSFSCILCACSHLGLVEEGKHYFERMVDVYKIKPRMEHYGCMVDLFGRSGLVKAAYEIINSMPIEPNGVILRSLMGACSKYGVNFDVDERMAKLLLKVEPELGSNYVLRANVSALSGNWNHVAELRSSMIRSGLKKVPGHSWMEMIGSGSVSCAL